MKRLFAILIVFIMSASSVFASSITIENANQKDVLNRLIRHLIRYGSTVENVSDYSFTAYNVDTNFFKLILFGSHIEVRYLFSAVQDNKNVILSVSMKGTTFSGSAHNTNIYSYKFQEEELLNALKKAIKGYYCYGFDFKKTRKGAKVTSIYIETPEVGKYIQVNDVITRINGQPVKGMSKRDVGYKLVSDKPQKDVSLTVLKKNKSKEPQNIILPSVFIKPVI